MNELSHPDRIRIRSAIGWLELGIPAEAIRELSRLRMEIFDDPDVLMVRWHAHLMAKKWSALKHISARLTVLEPLEPKSWLLHANSYYFSGNYHISYEIARLAVQQFPNTWQLHYEMACCAARLGRLREVDECLHRVFALGGEECLKI